MNYFRKDSVIDFMTRSYQGNLILYFHNTGQLYSLMVAFGMDTTVSFSDLLHQIKSSGR
jgi:hypothetical protein